MPDIETGMTAIHIKVPSLTLKAGPRAFARVRENGLIYSKFMHGLKLAGIELDRKVLADIAALNPADFKAICATASDALKKAGKAA